MKKNFTYYISEHMQCNNITSGHSINDTDNSSSRFALNFLLLIFGVKLIC